MNDSEIIKALECCYVLHQCEDCPCDYDTNGKTLCNEVGANILALINRQQAEIDRLNIDLKAMRGAANSWKAEVQRICKREFDNIEIDIETVKSEAVREFAERMLEEINALNYQDYNNYLDTIDAVDRLLEEMGCNDG